MEYPSTVRSQKSKHSTRTTHGGHEKRVKQLYSSFVRPHLEYAVASWNPYAKKDATTLEKVQKQATRLVSSLKNLSYEQMLSKLKLTNLTERRERGDLIEFYKITNGIRQVVWQNPNKTCLVTNE